jgi:membrane protein involved in colicin uptake
MRSINKVKSQELTRKALEGICGDIASQDQAHRRAALETAAAEQAKTHAEQIAELQAGLEAEKQARADAQEQAAACSEAVTRAERKTTSYAATLEKALINWQTEAQARVQAEAKARAEAAARAEADRRVKACAMAIAKAKERAASQLNSMHALVAVTETTNCECCGRKNLRKESSVRIDSGQLLCPDCLRELHQCQVRANGPSH